MSTKSSIKCPPRRIYSKDILVDWDVQIEIEKNQNLAQKWRDKAERELGETNDLTKARVKQLQHLLAVTTMIPIGRRDDAFLLRFLRAKKFDVDKALKMMQKYYSMKEHSPELFKVSPSSQLRDLLEMQIQYMVPRRDENGRLLYIFRVEKCDSSKCAVETVFRTNVLALENAIREPETQIGGLIVLLDMSGAGLGHAKFLSPHLSRKTVEVIQEAFPMRFKAFHILHEPFYFDAILSVLKPFLKEKIRRRIHLHGHSLASLHNHIAKDILPAEYGGNLPPLDNSEWRQQILADGDYFQHLESFSNSRPSNGDSYGGRTMSEANNNLGTIQDPGGASGNHTGGASEIIPSSSYSESTETDDDSEYELCSNAVESSEIGDLVGNGHLNGNTKNENYALKDIDIFTNSI